MKQKRAVRIRSLLQWALLIVLLGGLYQWQTRHMLETGSQVADITLMSLQGESVHLSAGDRPLLVYFFAPWCHVCALSIGNLESLEPQDVRVLTVAMDYGTVEEVWAFVQEHNLKGPVLLGHQGLKQIFNIPGYPTYYLLDQRNRVISSDMGYSSSLGLRLRQALAQGL